MLSRPDYTGGASTAQTGIGVEAPLDVFAATIGRSWRNTARSWGGPVAKQDTGCFMAMEWGDDGVTVT